MIFPCQQITSKHPASPRHCHCVTCHQNQVETGTTTQIKLRKTVSSHDDDDATPNPRVVTLIDVEGFRELPLRPAATTRQPPLRGRSTVTTRSSSRSSSALLRSSARPIPISMEEQRHRYRELQDMAEAESFYAKATWRMYRRITNYRLDHPLPDCYFDQDDDDDAMTTTTTTTSQPNDPPNQKDDPEGTSVDHHHHSPSSMDYTKATFWKNQAKFQPHRADDATRPNPSSSFLCPPNDDIDHDNDDEKEEHCMMFELDLA